MNEADTIVTGLGILDVFIGLAFIYFSLSMIGSTILEFLVGLVRYRARFLSNAITMLLDEPKGHADPVSLAPALLGHPMITKQAKPLSRLGRSLRIVSEGPSYLSSQQFSDALVDLMKSRVTDPTKVKSLHEGVMTLPPSSTFRQLVQPMVERSQTESEFVERISSWYDEYMDRMSGSYKRQTQGGLFFIGLLLAWNLNINTFEYAVRLSCDGPFREMIIEQALDVADNSESVNRLQIPIVENEEVHVPSLNVTPQTASVYSPESIAKLRQILSISEEKAQPQKDMLEPPKENLSSLEKRCNEQISLLKAEANDKSIFYFFGFVVTGLAVSLGSAFWLSLLRMMASIRSSLPADNRTEKTKTEGHNPTVNSAQQGTNNFESLLSVIKIEELQTQLGLTGDNVTGTWNIATRDVIEQWRKDKNIPILGPLTFDEYLKIMELDI